MGAHVQEPVSAVTEELTTYIHEALSRPIPEEVLEKGRHHLLDTVAAMVSGSRLIAGEKAIAYVETLGGTPSCTVIGTTLLTNAVNAALANGMMGHADETDDSHIGGRFHPGCGIVPAALASAELAQRSGIDLLKATILGYDIGVRANLSMGPRKLYQGGHSTHSVGTLFGGAASAGALMRFTREQIRYLLSYTVQQASGVQCWARDDQHIEKAFDFSGMTARNAMSGATMVAAGFTGVGDALSGHNNFYTAFTTDPRPEELSKELGTRFEVMETNIKKWCVGSPIQGAMDAATALIAARALTADKIARVVAELPDDRASLVDNRTMPNINVQHLIALVLVDGGLDFQSAHSHERMEDPKVVAMRAKVELVANPELTTALPPRQVILHVTTTGGETFTHHTRAVRGTPTNRMTREEVMDKALDLVGPIFGAEPARRLVDTFIGIDKVASVAALRPLLQGAV